MHEEGTGRSRRRGIVVLPTYNESQNLPILVPLILDATDLLDVMVVDDGSPDGTGAIAESLAREHAPRVLVLHRESKSGRGGAVMAGFREALKNPSYAGSRRWMPTNLTSQPSCRPSSMPVKTPTWW